MKVSLKTSGFRELERALAEELPRATAKNVVRRAGLTALKSLEEKAKQLAPKDSGGLADSITSKPVKARRNSRTSFARTDTVEFVTGPAPVGKVNRANASWQEFGTVNMPANPYMRPAFDETKEQVLATFEAEMVAQIEKAKGRIARKAARQAARS